VLLYSLVIKIAMPLCCGQKRGGGTTNSRDYVYFQLLKESNFPLVEELYL
jgi:hypothetical protein